MVKVYVSIPSRSEDIPFGAMRGILDASSTVPSVVDLSICAFSVCTARNRGVYTMLGTDCTHLLFVDADTYPPKDTITELLALNAPVASASVPTVDKSGLMYIAVAESLHAGDPKWFKGWPPERYETPYVGMACCLIQREVFEKVKFPWFKWSTDHDLHAPLTGEDAFFCRRVYEEGLGPIVATGKVRCGHKKRVDLKGLV